MVSILETVISITYKENSIGIQFLREFDCIEKYIFSFSKQAWFSTNNIRREHSLSSSGDKYDNNATSYQSWDPSTPVLMRMEKEGPGSYPPKLVQTFLKEVVKKNGEKIVIKYKNELNAIEHITYNVSKHNSSRSK